MSTGMIVPPLPSSSVGRPSGRAAAATHVELDSDRAAMASLLMLTHASLISTPTTSPEGPA
jgi:hypothetical protein